MSKKNTEGNRSSLRQVAEYLDVSPTTVSLALRGDKRISADTRKMVVEAAEKLNYEYVPRVRRSEKQRLRRFMFVVKNHGYLSSEDLFFGPLFAQVEESCRNFHISLSSVVLPPDFPSTNVLPLALTHDADGIFLVGVYPLPVINRIIRESGCPVVLLSNGILDIPCDSVISDNFHGAFLATQHLISLGHTRIVTVINQSENEISEPKSYERYQSYGRERYQGYCAACEAMGIPALPFLEVPSTIHHGILTNETHQKILQEYIDKFLQNTSRPTAFFGACDTLAMGLLIVLQRSGWRVPEDFSVVGFDDNELACKTEPPLTTIHSFYKDTMAQIAVERLIARVEGDQKTPLNIIVKSELRIRESTGPPSENP